MGVVRKTRHPGNFTIIDNAIINDESISYAALGVLLRFLSKPESWVLRIGEFTRPGKNGKTQIYRALEELQQMGYVVKVVGRHTDGRIAMVDYIAYEEPQTVDPDLAHELAQRQEKRRKKKQANNRMHAGQPRAAKPEMDQPNSAEPPPTKDRADSKDRAEKAEPSIPCRGKGGPEPSSAETEADVSSVDCPDTPEDLDSKPEGSTTETPAASHPEVAADAAPPRVMGTSDPAFPRNGPHPDWCAWVRLHDADNARAVSALYPRSPDVFTDPETARMYYKRRYTGVLTSRTLQLLVRFYEGCYLSPEEGRPRSLHELLEKNKLCRVLATCREEVRQAIEDIQMDGETDDGQSHVLNRIVGADHVIKPGTDMVDLLSHYPDHVAPLFVAAQVEGVRRLPEAVVLHRNDALKEIAKWPHWLEHLKEHTDYPQILGFTYEVAQTAVQMRADNNANRIAELKKYLT